ncbi:restriction endonuclease subunit S [Campylobacter sp. RM11259]|nr:restriction endonuclease subunit S [Campylobacter sp. RM11259]MBF6677582.1 restriction endonuclease subunit S [Campylobacter sp. RM11259]
MKLGDVFDFLKTFTNSRTDLNFDDEISYIHYGEIHTKYKHFIDFSISNLPKISLKKLKGNVEFIKNGDLVVVDASEDYKDIAKSVEIKNLTTKAVAGLHTFLLRDKNKNFANGYKGYILYCQVVKKEINRLATGISVLGISKNNLSNIKIPLPPLKEQTKIAEILSEFDTAINLMSNLISQKTKFKKALMQNLLTAKIRFPNFKDKWQEVSLDKIVFYQEGPGVRNTQYRKKGVKLLNVSNLNNNQLNLSTTTTYINKELAYGKYKHFLVDEGDLLISCSGINSESFKTKIAFAKKEHLPLCMNTSTMRFKNLDDSLSLKYLYYFFQTLNFEKQVFSILTGSAQFNFGPTHIKWFKIKLPNLDEQQKIAEILSRVDDEIEILNKKLENFKELKKGIMQNLLTGKVRVK